MINDFNFYNLKTLLYLLGTSLLSLLSGCKSLQSLINLKSYFVENFTVNICGTFQLIKIVCEGFRNTSSSRLSGFEQYSLLLVQNLHFWINLLLLNYNTTISFIPLIHLNIKGILIFRLECHAFNIKLIKIIFPKSSVSYVPMQKLNIFKCI